MNKLCVFFIACIITCGANADDDTFRAADDTRCATAVFANALATASGAVSEDDDEQTVQQWIYYLIMNDEPWSTATR